jgi:uncharacterized protein
MSGNGHGGARRGSGRKKLTAIEGGKPVPAIPAEPKKPATARILDMAAWAQIIEASRDRASASGRRPRTPEWNPFQCEKQRELHPPMARPKDPAKLMANDSALVSTNGWNAQQWSAGGVFSNFASEGLLFVGYPYLAELAQRPEYRLLSEIRAEESTRKWIKYVGNEKDDRAANRTDARIKELKDYAEHLQVRRWFKDFDAQDSFFGRSHIFIDLGAGLDQVSNPELKTPIGHGRDQFTDAAIKEGKLGKGCLKGLRTIEPIWAYPMTYNAVNPLLPSWYDPQVWYVMGTEIHATRLLTGISRPVPDILKPAYSFGGLSMSQMAQPYVQIWLDTRAAVGQIVTNYSIIVLLTDLQTLIQPGGADLIGRAEGFNALRGNQGLFMANKATEDVKNVVTSLAGLHELQSQAQEHLCSVARIPGTKFTGLQPQGFNATAEGEMRAFEETIHGHQEDFHRPRLTPVIDLMMISLWGERDDDITFEFLPLQEMSEKERNEMRKVDAEADGQDIDRGVISPEERRRKIAADPDSGYNDINPNDVPDLLEEEEEGLEPEKGRPQPVAGKGKGGKEAASKGGAEDVSFDDAALNRALGRGAVDTREPRGPTLNSGRRGIG